MDTPAPETKATTPNRPARLNEVLTRTGIAAWSLLGILASLYALLWVATRLEVLLSPIVVSVVLIYMLNPVVSRLAGRGLNRILATFVAFLFLLAVLVALGFLVVPAISSQMGALTSDFPHLFDDLSTQIESLAAQLGFNVEVWSYTELQEFINDSDNQDWFISAVFERLGNLTSGLVEAILVFVVAPVLAFYTLMDLPRVRDRTVELIPQSMRDEILFVFRRLGGTIGGFLRGQLLVAVIVGILMSIGFLIIDLDFWLIIGMVSGFLNIIPFVGPWVGGILGVTVGLLTGSFTTAFWAGIIALGVQQIDNHLVSPTVLRATVRLHPAVVILVLILGGALGGIWGVFLAVPVTAGIKIVVGHLWRTRLLGQSWEEAAEAILEERPPDPRERLARARAASTGSAVPVEDVPVSGEWDAVEAVEGVDPAADAEDPVAGDGEP